MRMNLLFLWDERDGDSAVNVYCGVMDFEQLLCVER